MPNLRRAILSWVGKALVLWARGTLPLWCLTLVFYLLNCTFWKVTRQMGLIEFSGLFFRHLIQQVYIWEVPPHLFKPIAVLLMTPVLWLCLGITMAVITPRLTHLALENLFMWATIWSVTASFKPTTLFSLIDGLAFTVIVSVAARVLADLHFPNFHG